MITQELKNEISEYMKRKSHSFGEVVHTLDVKNRITFTDDADLDFAFMDFFYDEELSMIIADMQKLSELYKFDRGYEHGKVYLSHYVGWYAMVDKQKHPALCSQKAYDVVIEKLSQACWRGHDKWVKKREAMNNE